MNCTVFIYSKWFMPMINYQWLLPVTIINTHFQLKFIIRLLYREFWGLLYHLVTYTCLLVTYTCSLSILCHRQNLSSTLTRVYHFPVYATALTLLLAFSFLIHLGNNYLNTHKVSSCIPFRLSPSQFAKHVNLILKSIPSDNFFDSYCTYL